MVHCDSISTPSRSEIVEALAKAICVKDYVVLHKLIANKGEFQIQTTEHREGGRVEVEDIPGVLQGLTEPEEPIYTPSYDIHEVVSVERKEQYIEWLARSINEHLRDNTQNAEINYTIDQCILCSVGIPVILFNQDGWPYKANFYEEKSRGGLMIEVENDLIVGVTFCLSFLVNGSNEPAV